VILKYRRKNNIKKDQLGKCTLTKLILNRLQWQALVKRVNNNQLLKRDSVPNSLFRQLCSYNYGLYLKNKASNPLTSRFLFDK
jgi:hypothetical protein